MYTAIYRDFRPDNFDQLVGQDHIVKILKNQIATGQTGHAYLFCGTRGTGKTTSARILAKALNCESEGDKPCGKCENCRAIKEGNFMDVIEIDAASNNGVDNIRELRESVKYPPVKGRNKIYIIDEVHMLSTSAFNALLKTLEEPPEHVVFIMATTEPQKLPATILSRCMRLDFRRVSESVIIDNMKMICNAKGLDVEEAALALIAVNADGSVRDSLSILEQCISGGETRITRDDVSEMLGTAGEEKLIELTEYVMNGNATSSLLLLDDVINSGRDVKQFMKEWLAHFRNLLMAKYIENPENAMNMSLENVARIKNQSGDISTELLNRAITDLSKTISDSRWSAQPRVMLEMCIVRLAAGQHAEIQPVFAQDGRQPFVRMPQQPYQPAAGQGSVPATAPQTGQSVQGSPSGSAEPSKALQAQSGVMDEDAYLASMAALTDEFESNVPEAANGNNKNASGKSGAGAGKNQDIDPQLVELWKTVSKKAVGEKPMLLRIETKAHLTKIDDANFYIRVDDDITEKCVVEKGKQILEDKMEMYYGKKLALCIDGTKVGTEEKKADTTDELARQIGQRFNVDVEIK